VSEWMLSTFSSPWACSPGLQSDRVVLRVFDDCVWKSSKAAGKPFASSCLALSFEAFSSASDCFWSLCFLFVFLVVVSVGVDCCRYCRVRLNKLLVPLRAVSVYFSRASSGNVVGGTHFLDRLVH
jgi:hypothetical protein